MKTYGLVRVSTLGQKENTSLENQSKRIRDYCSVYDLSLKEIITETESGGKNIDERTGLSKHKKLIESGEFCVKKEQVKRINKLLNQVSQISNLLDDITVK